MNNPRISIIIPAYNEEDRIAPTLKKITRYFSGRGESYEILVVDDGSKDLTGKIVTDLNIPEVHLLSYGKNRGKGYAVNYGVQHAKGNWILFTDADSSTPIEEFTEFWEQTNNEEIIIGSRYLPKSNITVKQSLLRIIGSRFGNALIQLLILPGIKDTQCGFKLFSKKSANEIFTRQTIFGWGFDMELLRIAKERGYKIKEMPITWHNDEQSKIQSSSVFTKTLSDLLAIKRNSLIGKYRTNKKFSETSRIIKFGLVGLVGTALDFAILNILLLGFDFNLYLAVSLGFVAGATNNYILNSLWSFGQLLAWKKFNQYFWISLIGLLLSNLVIFLVLENFDWNHNAAKLVAVIIVFGWNYIMNRQLTFRG